MLTFKEAGLAPTLLSIAILVAGGCASTARNEEASAPPAAYSHKPALTGSVRPSESALRTVRDLGQQGFFPRSDPRWSNGDEKLIGAAAEEFSLWETVRHYEGISVFRVREFGANFEVTILWVGLDTIGNPLLPPLGGALWTGLVSPDGRVVRVFRQA
jgi:hypothetical protein